MLDFIPGFKTSVSMCGAGTYVDDARLAHTGLAKQHHTAGSICNTAEGVALLKSHLILV
jgi:hypothetical protein